MHCPTNICAKIKPVCTLPHATVSCLFICNKKIKIRTRCLNQSCQFRLIFINVKLKIRILQHFKFRRVWIFIYQMKISNLVMSRFQLRTRPDFNFSIAKSQIRPRPDFNFGLQILMWTYPLMYFHFTITT